MALERPSRLHPQLKDQIFCATLQQRTERTSPVQQNGSKARTFFKNSAWLTLQTTRTQICGDQKHARRVDTRYTTASRCAGSIAALAVVSCRYTRAGATGLIARGQRAEFADVCSHNKGVTEDAWSSSLTCAPCPSLCPSRCARALYAGVCRHCGSGSGSEGHAGCACRGLCSCSYCAP